jgi:hypothetical protein
VEASGLRSANAKRENLLAVSGCREVLLAIWQEEYSQQVNILPALSAAADKNLREENVPMRKLAQPNVATALCALALCVVSAATARAQNSPKVVFQATADAKPYVVVAFHDTDQGTQLFTQDFTSLFASSQWTILDNHTLAFKSKDGSLAITVPAATSSDFKLVLPHARAKDGSVIDGEVFQDSSDATKGEAIVFLTLPYTDPTTNKASGTITYAVDVPLHFQ